MRFKFKRLLVVIIIVWLAMLPLLKNNDQQTIKFFPLDDQIQFKTAETHLSLFTEMDEDTYKVLWKVNSRVDQPIYLRQDVSLLFVDGKLKGIMNQWKEEESLLQQKAVIREEDSSYLEAISFHHGEIHYPDDIIKSVQNLSHTDMYVIDSPHSPLESFSEPENERHREWKQTMDHTISQQLMYFWKQLIEHYDISLKDYTPIPLTNLWKYENRPFPGLTQPQTNQVMGQLWEGLYKNYITGIRDENQSLLKPLDTYVPLILIHKDGKQLMVLFEDGLGNKQRLLQRIPEF
ncbi:hypothetical protein EDD68_101329 [Melghiribacillus thermohalophilus]|uniref:Uncharacterized protein n=1 Tax=Melghiribacillus thermohalophilus TaxID=1324956 RepID=A0A4R3NBE0_9BACI|nr:hypothetical protein [Melghiribacillus thermohalophilus]TCT26969.1 hypothetical protein EDD68_101329 [Melghiribacillus thermohalophilus]